MYRRSGRASVSETIAWGFRGESRIRTIALEGPDLGLGCPRMPSV
jgi:hypothetical protein